MSEERCGRWWLGEQIATGALAEVRAARPADDSPGPTPPVAIKRLHSHAARDPALAALFAAEKRLTTGLAPHPTVIAAWAEPEQTVDVDDRPYMVMRRVIGLDLRAELTRGPLPRSRWLTVVADIASALAHLHAHGWVHGDVNPANLLLDGDHAVLCDLGVARAMGEAGPVRGTAAYMAPEQVKGLAWTGAVDVFALGVVLWELASGARLFARDASFLSMAAVVETAAPPLADPPLASLAAAMLDRAAERRPTAAEVEARLAPLA